jgi:hypothetical protein
LSGDRENGRFCKVDQPKKPVRRSLVSPQPAHSAERPQVAANETALPESADDVAYETDQRCDIATARQSNVGRETNPQATRTLPQAQKPRGTTGRPATLIFGRLDVGKACERGSRVRIACRRQVGRR